MYYYICLFLDSKTVGELLKDNTSHFSCVFVLFWRFWLAAPYRMNVFNVRTYCAGNWIFNPHTHDFRLRYQRMEIILTLQRLTDWNSELERQWNRKKWGPFIRRPHEQFRSDHYWSIAVFLVTFSGTAWFHIQKFYVPPSQCIYVFYLHLRTNSNYVPIVRIKRLFFLLPQWSVFTTLCELGL